MNNGYIQTGARPPQRPRPMASRGDYIMPTTHYPTSDDLCKSEAVQ